MLKLFKIVAVSEGFSYLVLLANMLFVKPNNFVVYKKLLFPIGMAHGVLFIGYFILAFLLFKAMKWSFKDLAIILFGSLIPFGTFYIDNKYLKNA